MDKPREAYFIEKLSGYGAWVRWDGWSRWAGPFESQEEAELYTSNKFNWEGYRIAKYERTEIRG